MTDVSASPPVLLYDGVCGFCNLAVKFILKRDKRGEMLFAPVQSGYGKAVVERYPFLQNVDSIIFVENDGRQERVCVRSTAALRVMAYLGGIWSIFLIAYIIPRPIRDLFYDLFARYRYPVFGKYDSCVLPSPEVRARFIDIA